MRRLSPACILQVFENNNISVKETYAFARKFLLRNLSGNSGWRTEEAKARHDAHKIRTEIEAPEVTINQASIEGGEADAGISE